MFRDLKLTQKIFAIFILMLLLVMNSWAFTFTTVLDFRDSFTTVQQYSFPSIVVTSELKDHVHVGLLNVYNYVATGDKASKDTYSTEFAAAFRTEYELFTLSQTSGDFEFTQQFNEKLQAVSNLADELVALYESQPSDEALKNKLSELNTARTDFNDFVSTKITSQLSTQVEQANGEIATTVQTIQGYLVAVSAVVLLIIGFVSAFITNNITKPIRILTNAAQEFGKGNFQKITVTRRDEFGLFAKTFNTMAGNIQASQTALQEELRKTKELDRQKSEFLSVAAHQLRTPMSGIRWATQMLYDGDMGELKDEQKHHLGNALENIDRMVSLINDLLDVTKIEEQKFRYQFKLQDIVEVIKHRINNMQEEAESAAVKVEFTYEPVGELMVEFDADKFALAFDNLLDNAIKYSKKGNPVEVHLTKHGNKLSGFVRDHGLGIPKQSQNEVFTKFFRAPNVLKVITEGSGLGLFLVKDIITKHEGKIWFESAENVGTTFFFELPVNQSATSNAASPVVAQFPDRPANPVPRV